MPRVRHHFALEILDPEGRSLAQSRLEPDFGPAVEWTRFTQGRRRVPDFARLATADAEVSPVFTAPGSPFLDGFKVGLRHGGELLGETHFSRVVFSRAAKAAAADCVKRGLLPEGAQYLYRTSAYDRPEDDAPSVPVGLNFGVEVRPSLPAWRRGDFAALDAASRPFAEPESDELRVYVPARVLEETGEITTQAGANETGGILCGHLHHDPAANDLAVVVTEQIPAPHTEASSDALTFTPASWAAVRAALALRRRDEIILGWWHSHGGTKHWCAPQCGPERRRTCGWGRSFFSEADLLLQQTVFGQPFHVALVVTQSFESPPFFTLYGWREAMVRARGFRVLDQDSTGEFAAAPPANGDVSHEKAKPCT